MHRRFVPICITVLAAIYLLPGVTTSEPTAAQQREIIRLRQRVQAALRLNDLARADSCMTLIKELSEGGTVVRGTVTTTTWRKVRGPYRVAETITVPKGHTLTIEAGVDVRFDTDVQFRVQGRLNALGTARDSIRFLPGKASEWGGIRISGGDSSTFQYVRISGGNADGKKWPDDHGGGLHAIGGGTRIVMQHSVLSGNRAVGGGGLCLHWGVVAKIVETRISGNRSSGNAALMADGWNTTCELLRCSVSANSAYHVGGIWAVNGAFVSMVDCLVSGNSATHIGGICASMGSCLTALRCNITGNVAAKLQAGGGHAYWFSTISLTDCILKENSAVGYGGALYIADNSNLSMLRCILQSNTADFGGGVDALESEVLVSHSTFFGNRSRKQAGGVFSIREGSTLRMEMSTLYRNDAPGGKSVALHSPTSRAVINASILWPTSSPFHVAPGAKLSVTWSNIRGGWAGKGNISRDPMFVNPGAGDFHLKPGSPCIKSVDRGGWKSNMGAF
jgi:hypothetical protein